MHKVLITGAIHPVGLERLQQESDVEIHYAPDLPYPEILKIIGSFHCILTRSETPITRELIDCAPHLRVIARAAVGVGNIDIAYATERGILVINTPAKNTNSAAELTLGLLISAMRNLVPAHLQMAREGWDRHQFTGSELLGKTLGIVGLGNVGHRVARFALAFEMKVRAYDPHIADEVFERYQVRKVSWEELLTQADAVSAHVPKNVETTGMIGASEIAQMKPGVVIINAARGGVVDEIALLEALQSGQVAAAGIDTWEEEPPKNNPFRDLPQVVMTPHIGASTVEAQIRIAETIAVQVPKALRGEVVDFPVNMPAVQVLDSPVVKSYTTLAERLGLFAAQYIGFAPDRLVIQYRGGLAKYDASLLRLCFLRGLLGNTHEYVSYVNADRVAENSGMHVEKVQDSGFTDYESAVKFQLIGREEKFQIGGVVFSGPHPRIILLNGFVCEIEPEGTILVTTNEDRPGMIGIIGTCLGNYHVNIDQFELSRTSRGGEAMAMIRVDDDISEQVLADHRTRPGITSVRKIVL